MDNHRIFQSSPQPPYRSSFFPHGLHREGLCPGPAATHWLRGAQYPSSAYETRISCVAAFRSGISIPVSGGPDVYTRAKTPPLRRSRANRPASRLLRRTLLARISHQGQPRWRRPGRATADGRDASGVLRRERSARRGACKAPHQADNEVDRAAVALDL